MTFFKKTVIFHQPDDPYMTRWVINLGPFGCFRLHHIHRADAEYEHHDHPFSFISLVLKGWYLEELGGQRKTLRRGLGSIAFRNAASAHRIVDVAPGGAWTLLWTTPHRDEATWGFYTDHGWVEWQEFIARRGHNVTTISEAKMTDGPKVFKVGDPDIPEGAVYIGRGTKWGNPFRIGQHGDRAKVIELFETLTLPKIDVEPLRGRSLVCNCAPLACHGHSIMRKLNNG